MNWIILMVVLVVIVLVPAALIATFAGTKDTHQYHRHYGEHGFSQEVQSDEPQATNRDQQERQLNAEPPVTEWPPEL